MKALSKYQTALNCQLVFPPHELFRFPRVHEEKRPKMRETQKGQCWICHHVQGVLAAVMHFCVCRSNLRWVMKPFISLNQNKKQHWHSAWNLWSSHLFSYSSENRSCFLTEDTREIGKVTVGAIIDNCFVPKPSEQLQSSILQHHGRLRHEGWSKPRRSDTLRQFLIGRCLIKNYSTQFMHFCSYISL